MAYKKKLILVLIIITIFINLFSGEGMNKSDKLKGIIFFQTKQLKLLTQFYAEAVGCEIWMDQGGCIIFKAGNMLFGFCQRDKAELEGMITFFVDTKEEVDLFYKKFRKIALSSPKENPKYKIYHFFAKDPEGRYIEFQKFLGPIKDI